MGKRNWSAIELHPSSLRWKRGERSGLQLEIRTLVLSTVDAPRNARGNSWTRDPIYSGHDPRLSLSFQPVKGHVWSCHVWSCRCSMIMSVVNWSEKMSVWSATIFSFRHAGQVKDLPLPALQHFKERISFEERRSHGRGLSVRYQTAHAAK